MSSPIDLADVVRDLRDQLTKAAAESVGSSIRFNVGPIQLEFQVEVRRVAEGRGGIRFWVLDAGAKQSQEGAATQTIKLQLVPTDEISDSTLKISDKEDLPEIEEAKDANRDTG